MKKVSANKLQEFKRVWKDAVSCHHLANKKAMESGRILSELKLDNYGNWTKFVKNELSGVIGITQADKLIDCWEGRFLIIASSTDESLTINEMKKIILEATPEQKARAQELEQADVEKSLTEKQARFEDAQARKAKAAQDKKNGIIDGEFSEVKPSNEPEKINIEPKPTKPEPEKTAAQLAAEEFEEIIDEQISMNKALEADNASLVKIFESDDKLAVAVAELQKANALIIILEGRINGMMNEKNAAVRHAQMYKNRLEKLEKSLQSAV